MKGVDADIQQVAVLVNDPDGFLLPAVDIDLFQAVVSPDAMVDMRDIISRAQVVKLLEGDGLPAAVTVFEMVFVVSFKYLVIGVKRQVQLPVDKSFMQGNVQGGKVESPSVAGGFA